MSQQDLLSVQQIKLSPDGNQLLLTIIPIDSLVTKESIVCLLQHPTLPKFKLNIAAIELAVSAFAALANSDQTEVDAENGDETIEFETIAIAEKQDAQLKVVISPDKMSAYAEIICAYGGESIHLCQIKEQCDELGITFGLLPKTMLLLINTCLKSLPGKIYKVNIAKGIPVEDGKDATFKRHVNTDNHRKPTPQLLPNGKVDMKNLGKTITVEPGTLLMTKIPATTGKPGKTVTAEVINQKVGVDHQYPEEKNVHVDPDNPANLIATTYGVPIFTDGFVRVDDVLVLEDINVKTGHVDYNGTIVITGDIHEGMTVKTTGDITVLGLIESANVVCGGDLSVKMPIIGHYKQANTEYSCEINCKGNLTGTIAQYTHLTVGKDLIMTNQLIHCATECKGSVMVHNEHFSKGSIIGGITQVWGNITTTTVGTSAGNKTTIDLIGDFKKLSEDKKHYVQELQNADELIQKVKLAETKANSLLDIQERKTKKATLAKNKQAFRDKSDEIQSQLFDTKMKLKHYYDSTNLIATKSLFSGVTVTIGKQNWNSSQKLGPSIVAMHEKTLTALPYQKK